MPHALTEDERRTALEVLRLRYWQHLVNEDLKKKRFTIPIHLAIGHEAIAVAVHHAMEPTDQLVLTHRNIAYHLARLGALAPVVEEYQRAPSGLAKGRLGSMNLINPARGVLYSSSVLGNNLSVGCGLALAQQIQRRSGCVIILTGDGAMEEGPFYETLVFAQSHHLPVLVVVENNDCSMSSTIAQRRCPIALASLCDAVGMPFQLLAGNDVFAYRDAVRAAAQVVRGGNPACLEVQLAAINQHAGPTPGWPTDPKSISLERGLIVEETPRDPVFVLQQRLGQELWTAFSEQVMGLEPSPSLSSV